MNIENIKRYAGEFARADGKLDAIVAKLVGESVVTADGSEPDKDAVIAFKDATADVWSHDCYKPVHYVLTSAADGTVQVVPKGTADAVTITVQFARSVKLSELTGSRDDLSTVRGLVTSIRDAANKYIDTLYSRLSRRANPAKSGGTRESLDFWAFFAKESDKIAKRAVKEKICSSAEFKIARGMMESRLKGEV